MSRVQFTQLVAELAAQSRFGHVATFAAQLARQAWLDRDVVFPRPGSPTILAATLPPIEIPTIGEVDLSEIYRDGAKSSDAFDALTALTWIGFSASWPSQTDDRLEMAQCLLWLETYSGLRCLTACAALLDGTRQRQLAEAMVHLLESGSARISAPSPAELQIGRAWLASSTAPACAEFVERASKLNVSGAPVAFSLASETQQVEGNLGPRPRHPLVTIVLALTGILFVVRAAQACTHLVLLRRAPTSLWLSERGLELFSRHEMLGRVLRERRLIVPIDDLRMVEREVRFPRFGLYAGLLALAVGTLVGVRLFIDGLRVVGLSFPLVGLGLASVVVGVLLDLYLTGFGDTMRGRCRLVILAHRGRGWTIGDLEPNGVDRLLTELSMRLATRRSSMP